MYIIECISCTIKYSILLMHGATMKTSCNNILATVFRTPLIPLSRPSAFFYFLFTNISDNRSYPTYGVESVGIYPPNHGTDVAPDDLSSIFCRCKDSLRRCIGTQFYRQVYSVWLRTLWRVWCDVTSRRMLLCQCSFTYLYVRNNTVRIY